MKPRTIVACLTVFLTCLASIAGATVWRVERDGSGDFSTLQSAIDAAASGDTIQVGPGRYNEIASYSCPDMIYDIRASVHQAELTIIGSGADQTVVGQDIPWEVDQGVQMGIVAIGFCGNESLYVRDIGFENLKHAIHAEYSDRIDISECRFSENYHGVITDCRVINAVGCTFEAAGDWANFLTQFALADSIRIERCDATLVKTSAQHFAVATGDHAYINDCRFHGGGTALNFAGNGGAVRNCVFSGAIEKTIYLSSLLYGTVDISECVFRNVEFGIIHEDHGDFMLKESTFEDVIRSCFWYDRAPAGFINDNILDKGARYVFETHQGKSTRPIQYTPRPIESFGPTDRYPTYSTNLKSSTATEEKDLVFDATDNWWGSTNPDSIQAWILDGNDMPDLDCYFVWQPYKTEPLTDSKRSLSGIKAIFR